MCLWAPHLGHLESEEDSCPGSVAHWGLTTACVLWARFCESPGLPSGQGEGSWMLSVQCLWFSTLPAVSCCWKKKLECPPHPLQRSWGLWGQRALCSALQGGRTPWPMVLNLPRVETTSGMGLLRPSHTSHHQHGSRVRAGHRKGRATQQQ